MLEVRALNLKVGDVVSVGDSFESIDLNNSPKVVVTRIEGDTFYYKPVEEATMNIMG